MNKKFVIKTLTTVGIILVGAIIALAIVLAIITDDSLIRAMSIGVGVGALVGGLLKCLVVIPRKYKDKDERSLLVVLLSNLISQSVFGLTSYLCLMLTITKVVSIDSYDIRTLLIFVGIIVFTTFIAEKIAYKLIDSKM